MSCSFVAVSAILDPNFALATFCCSIRLCRLHILNHLSLELIQRYRTLFCSFDGGNHGNHGIVVFRLDEETHERCIMCKVDVSV
ncbi:MAG: hypothetical protein NXY57DRAFT_1021266 [Lentinula lateritia]|nr:MAG: hypothetical protein NXY57DRAFT_1021266 [Lentinula lateritia]